MNINDVRGHLGKAIAELSGASDSTAEEQAQIIERAKAMSGAVAQYVAVVKVELDACRVYADTGLLPAGVEVPQAPKLARPAMRAIGG